MKALIISSLLFFSLRAMSSEIGECIYSSQSNKREAKTVGAPMKEDKKEAFKTMSK